VFNVCKFSQQVNYICNLETNGSFLEAAYEEISELWQHLKQSKSNSTLANLLKENGKSDA